MPHAVVAVPAHAQEMGDAQLPSSCRPATCAHDFSQSAILQHKVATVILLSLVGDSLEQVMLSVCVDSPVMVC